MRIKKSSQLKDFIKKMAKEQSVSPNILLQIYMMERLLERISVSIYKPNFILKGGFLISSILGINLRTTMDIDTTIKGITVTQDSIKNIMEDIISINLDDKVYFKILNISGIREIGEYDDFRVSLEAVFESIRLTMKVDITTGDIIIPHEVNYNYRLMFEERKIEVFSYNLDTILAEKIESIIVRNISNTRARDFYDVYVLYKFNKNSIDIKILKEAVVKKAVERNTKAYLDNYQKYIKDIEESEDLKKMWKNYVKKYPYAEGIEYSDIVKSIEEILNC